MDINEKEKEAVLEKFEQVNQLCSTFRAESISYTLIDSIIKTLKTCFDDVFNDDSSIYQRAHALRYIFEALISTSLLNNENNYKEKLYYSYYLQQINKLEIIINKAEIEIAKLEELDVETNKIRDELIPKLVQAAANGQGPEGVMAEIDRQENVLYDELEKHTTLFTSGVKHNGAGFQAHLVREQNLKVYQENLEKLTNEFDTIAQKLSKDSGFNERFEVNHQSSKVKNVLRDNRTWKQKAQSVGLDEEYSFVYNYTSSILHFTSYSFFTRNDVPSGESNVINNLALKYISRILTNIHIFLNIPEGVYVIAVTK